MKAGKYSIKELFNNRYVEQIVIPEIQRDYVWGKTQVEGLLSSIYENFEAFKKGVGLNQVPQVGLEIQKAFEQFYTKQKFACNIGFIYAYNDPEYSGKYFLIDGQQRLTTIYLILLVLASEKHEFRDAFLKLFTHSGLPIIDYRVREASHHFMKEVVDNYNDNGIEIQNQSWFYSSYKNDKTISSIISNIETIKGFLYDKNLIIDDFIDYIQNYIEFWYFDTNISEQGEELYIYMNARGEQMQKNENLKADLLGKLTPPPDSSISISDLKNDWGKKWEDWQQFFWENRNGNPNADIGFNEFISCITGLESYRNSDTWEDAEKDISKLITLEKVEKYINAFMQLVDKRNEFEKQYSYSAWIQKCFNDIWQIFNKNETDWLVNYKNPNKATERNRMVFIWSWLYYITRLNEEGIESDGNQLYRFLRFFYVRYNNFNRSVSSLKQTIDLILINGIWDTIDNELMDRSIEPEEETDTKFRTREERIKNQYLNSFIDKNDLIKAEELIWKIEDHPLNIDGKDVGNINISHLIDLEKCPDLNEMELVRDKLFELFPVNKDDRVDESNWKRLINILIFYGSFWERESPWYCMNYYFANWKRIIRGVDNQLYAFRNFFEYYKTKSLDKIYKEKVVKFDADFNSTNFSVQMKWYAANLEEKLWEQGYYIVYDHYNYPENDTYFVNTQALLNTKGNFKGGNPQILSELIK